MKLRDRLLRLERRAGENLKVASLPPGLLSVLTYTVAVVSGNYRDSHGPAGPDDSYADAYARALGYADRSAMEAAIGTDPVDWGDRLWRVVTALLEGEGVAAETASAGDIGHVCRRALEASGRYLSPSIRQSLRGLAAA